MARISPRLTIRIPVDAGKPVEFICRRPSAAEHSAFLKSRITEKRNKIKTDVLQPRLSLIDKILIDCRHVEIDDERGEQIELNSQTVLTDAIRELYSLGADATWKDLIPTNWKSSAGAYFEETTVDEEDSEGNS